MDAKGRCIRDVRMSLTSASNIVNDLPATLTKEEIGAVRAAANQARQATKELDTLVGMLTANSK